MHIFREVKLWKAHLRRLRLEGASVGLVPTMGALHEGHLSLIRRSKSENAVTVCSIYVNPAQFNNPQDLKNYPRTLESDLELLKTAGCDAVFCPGDEEMYSGQRMLSFGFGTLDQVLEGMFRPGHFSGVALVVSKLFNIIEPDRAYFGLKDYQQFRIISQMVRELKFNLQVIGSSIIRESDGLAMSSRNRLLLPEQRRSATALFECLQMTRTKLLEGGTISQLMKEAMKHCNEKGVKLEYLALADREDLSPLERMTDLDRAMLLIAAHVGSVRLIDNLFIKGENE